MNLPRIIKKTILQQLVNIYRDEKDISFYIFLIGTLSLVSKEFYQITGQLKYNEILVKSVDSDINYIQYLLKRGIDIFILIRNIDTNVKLLQQNLNQVIEIVELQYYIRHKIKRSFIIDGTIEFNYINSQALLSNFIRAPILYSLDNISNYKRLNLEIQSSNHINDFQLLYDNVSTIPPNIYEILYKHQTSNLIITNGRDNCISIIPSSKDRKLLTNLKSMAIHSNAMLLEEYNNILINCLQLEKLGLYIKKYIVRSPGSTESVSLLIDSLIQHPSMKNLKLVIGTHTEPLGNLINYLNKNTILQSIHCNFVCNGSSDSNLIYNNTIHKLIFPNSFQIISLWNCSSNLYKLPITLYFYINSVDFEKHPKLNQMTLSNNILEDPSISECIPKLNLLKNIYIKLILYSDVSNGKLLQTITKLKCINKLHIHKSISINNFLISFWESNHSTITSFSYEFHKYDDIKQLGTNTTIQHLTLRYAPNHKNIKDDFMYLLWNKPNLKSLHIYGASISELEKETLKDSLIKYYANHQSPLSPTDWSFHNIDKWDIYKTYLLKQTHVGKSENFN
ncbi:hypothetical protein DLAC_10987 [Tieghemostelium lacteum]|uniref:Uncharacterized protein n=1 Tax=Tieghemostelium lacteum TaxID=361077 RepID=A0A151Z2V9_TIELA|nr:hypothetical protein DLAC_10987 [Tieghemostelium lacteum]|eukprot:KYQ88292.1 hypothetical protein DLAC_10987 [Tieghemostelium lacteum]